MIERVLKGEKAILAEYDVIRRRDERNKLTRINQGNDIELGK